VFLYNLEGPYSNIAWFYNITLAFSTSRLPNYFHCI